MSNKFNFPRSFSRKGYYIALILCAAAIGISGYLYYRNTIENDDPQLNDPSGIVTPGDDIQAGATLPGGDAQLSGTLPDDSGSTFLRVGRPLSGNTIHDYAMDCLSYNETTRDWRTHNGIDIAAEAGSQVCAAAKGTVYSVYKDDTMGYTVTIRHEGGYVTKYASLDEQIPVAPGDIVELGDVIGTVANTALIESAMGDHLHFSVTCNDESMDPSAFLQLGS